ncbi:MAG: PAS domain S-box protein [Sporocytophaga sp.]|uniref:PAS domain-containing sensor histidine kinase n=1 Tax=Sporocytophaga sp. TaxID=2231183 RepID=UPI001B037C38|nr:PAS domain S-box protein [Sporocytophaga sp.]MBO9702951.1 PAS domain S-box protein [Sporocytophaga sp.]
MELELDTLIEAEFFNLSSDLMIVMKKGRLMQVNTAWKQILGWTPEEVKGRQLIDFIHPDDVEMALHVGKAIHKAGIDIYVENKYLTKDGSYKWISWKTFAKSGLVLGVGKEITHDKEKDAHYRKIDNYRNSLLENARYLIISLEKNGIIRTFNRAAESMLGYRAIDVAEKITPTLFFNKSELQERSRELEAKIGQPVNYGFDYFLKSAQHNFANEQEWLWRRKDGTQVPLHLSVSPVRDEHNEISGFLIIGSDISQKRAAQKRLKDSETIFKAMNDASPLGIFLTDANGECIYSNRAFQSLTGLDLSETFGFFWNKIVHEEEKSEMLQLWDAAIASHTNFQKKIRLVSSSNTIKWVDVNAALINEHEPSLGYVGIVVDITKEIESKRELEGTLITLEKSNKALDNFAYVVSHDLKAPLKSIAAMINFIEDDLKAGGNNASEYVKLLMGRVCKMAEIIEGVLDFSRIGHHAVRKEFINVKQLVTDQVEFLTVEKPADIRIEMEEFEIIESKILLTQIFSNLISNAVKYNDKEKCKITIRGKLSEGHCYFEVEDNGPGIPEEFHERVFGLFATLRDERVKDSTGIGLAIVKKIIEEELNGSIRIQSKMGLGTIFIFSWETRM